LKARTKIKGGIRDDYLKREKSPVTYNRCAEGEEIDSLYNGTDEREN